MMAEANERHRAVYIISVAAELTGVHPQTLRVYERKGLLAPARTGGMSRRYSDADLDKIRRVQELTNEGLNLVGVARIIELEAQIERLRARVEELSRSQRSTALVPLRQSMPYATKRSSRSESSEAG
jgi:MerR family transcriptional regulator/heat shock protein HspR